MLTGGLGYSYNVTNAEPLTQTNLRGVPDGDSDQSDVCRHARTAYRRPGRHRAERQQGRDGLHRPPRHRRGQALQCVPPGTRHVHGRRIPRRAAQRRHDVLVVPHPEPGQRWLVGGLRGLRARHPCRGQTHATTTRGMRVDSKGVDNQADFEDFSRSGIRACWPTASSATCRTPITSARRPRPMRRVSAATASRSVCGEPLQPASTAVSLVPRYDLPHGRLHRAIRHEYTATEHRCLHAAAGVRTDAERLGRRVTANTGTYYGDGFRYNAGTAASAAACTANGTVVPANPPQGIIQATPETLVMSATVAVCTGCHDSNLAISHMRVNGGSFYESRTALAAPTAHEDRAVHGLPLGGTDGRHQGGARRQVANGSNASSGRDVSGR